MCKFEMEINMCDECIMYNSVVCVHVTVKSS